MKIFITCFVLSLLFLQGFSQDSGIDKHLFKPELNGILKTKYEYNLDNNLSRFEVRNARFGAKGNVNKYFSYCVEIDLSDEGQIRMLDAYAKYKPVKGLEIYLGQLKVPFSSDYIRNPAENFFANRSFVAKYVNSGLRDIGITASYISEGKFPFQLWFALLNGTGYNNPAWVETPNLASRIIAGPWNNFRFSANVYTGKTLKENNLFMYGPELRYMTKNLLLETEYIHRQWHDTSSSAIDNTKGGWYFHAYYHFRNDNSMIKIITPTMRWDLMGDDILINDISANRLTLGVNLGFDPRPFYSELRLNYENYFTGYLPNHTDKFTIEFIARF